MLVTFVSIGSGLVGSRDLSAVNLVTVYVALVSGAIAEGWMY